MRERTDDMPKITHRIHAEIDISQPVPELIGVISAVLQTWPGKEREILTKLKGEIQHTIDHLEKEAKARDGKPLREFSRQQQDQR